MNDDEALDAAVQHMRCPRFRWLCSAANRRTDGHSAAAYRQLMHRIATSPDPPMDPRPIDVILAEAKAGMGDEPIRTEPREGCCD